MKTHILSFFFVLIAVACASKENVNLSKEQRDLIQDQQDVFSMREAQQGRIN